MYVLVLGGHWLLLDLVLHQSLGKPRCALRTHQGRLCWGRAVKSRGWKLLWATSCWQHRLLLDGRLCIPNQWQIYCTKHVRKAINIFGFHFGMLCQLLLPACFIVECLIKKEGDQNGGLKIKMQERLFCITVVQCFIVTRRVFCSNPYLAPRDLMSK